MATHRYDQQGGVECRPRQKLALQSSARDALLFGFEGLPSLRNQELSLQTSGLCSSACGANQEHGPVRAQ